MWSLTKLFLLDEPRVIRGVLYDGWGNPQAISNLLGPARNDLIAVPLTVFDDGLDDVELHLVREGPEHSRDIGGSVGLEPAHCLEEVGHELVVDVAVYVDALR